MLIIILDCSKLSRYLLTFKDDLHRLHAYLSILESNSLEGTSRYLGHDKVVRKILEKRKRLSDKNKFHSVIYSCISIFRKYISYWFKKASFSHNTKCLISSFYLSFFYKSIDLLLMYYVYRCKIYSSRNLIILLHLTILILKNIFDIWEICNDFQVYYWYNSTFKILRLTWRRSCLLHVGTVTPR